MKHRTFLVTFALLGGFAAALTVMVLVSGSPTTVRADPGSLLVAPAGDCGGAEPCYAAVQDAVDAASDGDIIKVAAGTYSDVHVRGGITQVVYISKTVTVRGGYSTGNGFAEPPDPVVNATTLDAGGQGRALVINGPITATTEGLGITGGDASGLGGPYGGDTGGGVYVDGATVTIQDCLVYSNTASTTNPGFGGGLYLYRSDATLSDNTVQGNTASTYGSGTGLGGGLYIWDSDATLSSNIIVSNTASPTWGDGGGLYFLLSDATLNSNAIIGNAANAGISNWGHGGGLYFLQSDASLTSNLVAGNHASFEGAGLWFRGFSSKPTSGQLWHNTVVDNDGSGQGVFVGENATVAFTNTIIAGHHSVGITVTEGSTVSLEATLWYGNVSRIGGLGSIFTGTINILGNPAFVNPSAGDYHLTAESAAIDEGVDAGVSVDIDGQPRPVGAGYDLGADEWMTSVTADQTTGGTLVYTDTQGSPTVIVVAGGAVTDTTALVFVPFETAIPPAGFSFAGHAFDLNAYRDGQLLTDLAFEQAITVTIHYSDADVAGLDEETLELRYWDGDSWTTDGITVVERNIVENYAVFSVTHLTEFALFASSSEPSAVVITKTVTPEGRVNYGDALTYTLVISATPGTLTRLYDPLTGTSFLRFLAQPEGINHDGGAITGTLMVSPGDEVAISFVVEAHVPEMAGTTANITNRACVYPFDGTLGGCAWSEQVTNEAFRPHEIFLPLVIRNP